MSRFQVQLVIPTLLIIVLDDTFAINDFINHLREVSFISLCISEVVGDYYYLRIRTQQ